MYKIWNERKKNTNLTYEENTKNYAFLTIIRDEIKKSCGDWNKKETIWW